MKTLKVIATLWVSLSFVFCAVMYFRSVVNSDISPITLLASVSSIYITLGIGPVFVTKKAWEWLK